MPRLTLSQKTEHESREAAWLRALEAGDTSIPDLSRLTGLSIRRVQARLQRARENRTTVEEEPRTCQANDDLPWVELIDGGTTSGPHYDLAGDTLVLRKAGPFRIGDGKGRRLRVQNAGNGKPVEQPAKSKAKFKPKQPKRKRTTRS